MIHCSLLKLPFIWNFHNKIFCRVDSNTFRYLKYDCVIKASELFSFLPLINSSVTIGLSFLLTIISAIMSSKAINTLCSFLGLYSLIFL